MNTDKDILLNAAYQDAINTTDAIAASLAVQRKHIDRLFAQAIDNTTGGLNHAVLTTATEALDRWQKRRDRLFPHLAEALKPKTKE